MGPRSEGLGDEEIPGMNSRCRPIWCSWRWASSTWSTGAWSNDLGVQLDGRGNLAVEKWMSSVGVFAAGDTVRGASLVVHAINEGRLAAAAIDKWLAVASN